MRKNGIVGQSFRPQCWICIFNMAKGLLQEHNGGVDHCSVTTETRASDTEVLS